MKETHIRVADEEMMTDFNKAAKADLKVSQASLTKYGTPQLVESINGAASMPTRNFQSSWFEDAEKISEQLQGRKAQVNLALVALDRARVFQLARAKEIIVEELTDNVVKDPVDTEILSVERTIKNILPEGL